MSKLTFNLADHSHLVLEGQSSPYYFLTLQVPDLVLVVVNFAKDDLLVPEQEILASV